MAQLKPLGERVLIKRQEAQKTKGGIYLPETAQEKPKQGTIVAIGSEKVKDLKIGDKILFAAYAGSEVRMGDEEGYLILPADEVLCVLE